MALIIDGTVVVQTNARATKPKQSTSKPTQEQLDSWTAAYAAADAASLGAPTNVQKAVGSAAGRSPSEIRETQAKLNALGFDTGGIDGLSGPKTYQAVRDFQQAHGLTVDGIVGPKTRAALAEANSLTDRQRDIDAIVTASPAAASVMQGELRADVTAAETRIQQIDQDLDALGTSSSSVSGALRSEQQILETQLRQYRAPQEGTVTTDTSIVALNVNDPPLPISLDLPPTPRSADDVAQDYAGPTDSAVSRQQALEILTRDFSSFDSANHGTPDGLIGDSDLVAILEGEEYSDDQKAAAAYFYLNPGDFAALDNAHRPDSKKDGLVGAGDLAAAGPALSANDRIERALVIAGIVNESPEGVFQGTRPDGSDRRLAIIVDNAGHPEALERFDETINGVPENEVIRILGRDYHDVFGRGGDGITREKLADIVLDDEGTYTTEQRAVAAYYLDSPEKFDGLERSQRGDGNWSHDGRIGEGDILDAGGSVGPSRAEILAAGKDELQRKHENGDISAADLSSGLTALDNAAELSPAEFSLLHKSVLGGQAGIALYQAATGDADGAFETAFDTLVPLAAKHILTKAGAGAVGGPVGVLLSLVLALGPLDTSETRVAAASENSGEINDRGQRIYPGGHGTRLDEVMNSQIPAG